MKDSRAKINSPIVGGTAFLAYFDVLTAPLIRRVQEAPPPVTAVVLDPPLEILSARARAELAASLSSISSVVPCPGDPAAVLERLQPVKIVDWENEDADRIANLIRHVRALYRPE